MSKTTARSPRLDTPAQAPSRLIRQILQEQRIHSGFETDMHFIRQAFGNDVQGYALGAEAGLPALDHAREAVARSRALIEQTGRGRARGEG